MGATLEVNKWGKNPKNRKKIVKFEKWTDFAENWYIA